MQKARITWVDPDGQHDGITTMLDWLAWEKHTGKSAAKLADNFTHLEDILFLAWHVAKRNGEKRPFDGFVARLAGLPEIVSQEEAGPTQPGA